MSGAIICIEGESEGGMENKHENVTGDVTYTSSTLEHMLGCKQRHIGMP
jgi:hypothetical protein